MSKRAALQEATVKHRNDDGGDGTLWQCEATCFLSGPLVEDLATLNGKGKLTACFHSDRECEEYTRYRQGYDPKEHTEMLMHQVVREDQRQRAKDEREWREYIDRRDRIWREEDQKKSRREYLVNLVVFGLLVTAITVTGELIANGCLPWFEFDDIKPINNTFYLLPAPQDAE